MKTEWKEIGRDEDGVWYVYTGTDPSVSMFRLTTGYGNHVQDYTLTDVETEPDEYPDFVCREFTDRTTGREARR